MNPEETLLQVKIDDAVETTRFSRFEGDAVDRDGALSKHALEVRIGCLAPRCKQRFTADSLDTRKLL